MEGLYGSIVVRQPPRETPNRNLYDYDLTAHVILLSDWLHEDSLERYPGRLAVNTGQNPDTVLINGKGQFMVLLVSNIINHYIITSSLPYKVSLKRSVNGVISER